MKHTFGRLLAALGLATTLTLTACAAPGREASFSTDLVGIDNLPQDYLSVSAFWINGEGGGFQAGKGGRHVCCVSLPDHWYPGAKAHVEWHVSDWKAEGQGEGGIFEADVPLDPYAEHGTAFVHFLPGNQVRIVVSIEGPRSPTYPGPHDPIPDKQPWVKYPPPVRTGPLYPDGF